MKTKRWTEPDILKCIVKNTPLISIDLIVRNKEGKILLGLRKNRPAQNYYFVPGGRIFKNETIEEAFKSISENELGISLDINKAKFLGVYQHFYEDNFFGDDFGTHYVVLAYEILVSDIPELPEEQHSNYIWMSPEEIIKSRNVHQYTKNYFL
jgi:colanic acid biosynthesis protein WcaH